MKWRQSSAFAALLVLVGCSACSRTNEIKVVKTQSNSGQNQDECWITAENRHVRYTATSHQEPCDVNIGDTMTWSGALILEREGKASNMYFIRKSEAK
jgi:hypothetical protein